MRTTLAATSSGWLQAIEELAPRFPHDEPSTWRAAVEELRGWDFGKPDFTRALELFRPELSRTDGIEHLVLFPMYKQNGSRDTCFEALIVRVPWPDWIAELERTRYDNPKFVPVELVDATRGYDSECAVLFPETVSAGTADRPARLATSARSSATVRPRGCGAWPAPRPIFFD